MQITKKQRVIVVVILTFLLFLNYMSNVLSLNRNPVFEYFQADSETLVTGMIEAKKNGISSGNYGLGRYTNSLGTMYGYWDTFLTDNNWNNGYSVYGPQILFPKNKYIETVAKVGNSICFENGSQLEIGNVTISDEWIEVSLNTEKKLTEEEYGTLDQIAFFDEKNNPLPKGLLESYASQYGLQGKIFSSIALKMDANYMFILQFFCSILMAIVIIAIVVLLAHKFDSVFALCSYMTFLLSPWVVNFARNLYWVEFTWFLPILVGLVCSIYIQNSIMRRICYIGAFCTMLLKCLCGYEYITTIMIGSISFLIVDFLVAIMNKDKIKKIMLFKAIFSMSAGVLLGFCAALAVHATLRGNGDILQGVSNILMTDGVRRTIGDVVVESNSIIPRNTILCVLLAYFNFETDILTGINGKLFVFLCIVPLIICGRKIVKYKMVTEELLLYGINFIASVSWFILAKSHSYVHTHMNYVLWYFGFIQVCIYIIVRQIETTINSSRYKKKEYNRCPRERKQ